MPDNITFDELTSCAAQFSKDLREFYAVDRRRNQFTRSLLNEAAEIIDKLLEELGKNTEQNSEPFHAAPLKGGKVFDTAAFADLVDDGCFTEDDGFGYYCWDDRIPVEENGCRKPVDLNDSDDIRDSGYPWIVWYNL